MTEEEKKIKQQQIEDMINETDGENLEEIFNETQQEQEQTNKENEDINIGGVLNTDLILSMMGSIVQGAYTGLPAEEANASYVKWYTINKTIFTGLNMDNRLKNIKLVNVPDPIAYLIAGGAVIASTIIFVNAGKKKQLEKVQEVQEKDNKWKKEEVPQQQPPSEQQQKENEYEEMKGEQMNMKAGEEY
jgi:uncharacterized membrane protein